MRSITRLITALLVAGVTTISVSAEKTTGTISTPPIVLDAHVDILLDLINPKSGRALDEPGFAGQANFANWKAGNGNAVFFAVWIDPRVFSGVKAVERADALIDCFMEQVKRYPEELVFCQTEADIRAATAQGKMAGLMGIEGGSAINNDLSHIERFRNRGVRYMTLTWRGNLEWAGSSQPIGKSPWDRRRGGATSETETQADTKLSSGGLTDFGRQVIAEMNRVGMIVDISHVSDQTFFDALAATKRPVFVSHSNARALSEHPRNISDDMLRGLAKNGGVTGLNLWYELLEPNGRASKDKDATSVTVESIVDQIDHIAKVAGIDHVGLGTDFEGISDLPPDVSNASKVPLIFDAMRRRGYSEDDIKKVAAENFLRVIRANDTLFEESLSQTAQ